MTELLPFSKMDIKLIVINMSKKVDNKNNFASEQLIMKKNELEILTNAMTEI